MQPTSAAEANTPPTPGPNRLGVQVLSTIVLETMEMPEPEPHTPLPWLALIPQVIALPAISVFDTEVGPASASPAPRALVPTRFPTITQSWNDADPAPSNR